MSVVPARRCWLQASLAMLLAFGWPVTILATALFDHGSLNSGGNFSDVLANPNDHLSWNGSVIKYSFDSSFDKLFPDPRFKDQVRLALAEWSAASALGYGANFGYEAFDTTIYDAFIDLRSVTTHELGHVLGLAHPDIAAESDLNFVYNPDGQAPGGETLTKVNTSGTQGTEVMHLGLAPGDIIRILTWDELDGYYLIYGSRVLSFVEVPSGGNLVFRTWKKGDKIDGEKWDDMNLALTHHAGNAGTVATGSTITSASISYSATPPLPIGFQTHGNNWTITCKTLKTHTVDIRTSGSDNQSPMGWYNNLGTPYVFFGSPDTPPTAFPVGSDSKNDIIWDWRVPGTSAATDIPINSPFHPGLELDVHDWIVVNCTVYDITGIHSSIVPLVVADSFNDALVASSVAISGPLERFPARRRDSTPGALSVLAVATNRCVQGFALIATEAPQTVLSGLKLADVTGMGLSLSNLNSAELSLLQASNRVLSVTNFGVHTLGSRGRFIVALQGSAACMPSDVISNGNYVILNRPDLLGKELFVTVQSTNAENNVENFAMVGEPPVTGPPALTINFQASSNSFALAWPAPSDGFVLQQNTDLGSTNWVNVPTAPVVAIDPGLGFARKEVQAAQTNRMFYRLLHP